MAPPSESPLQFASRVKREASAVGRPERSRSRHLRLAAGCAAPPFQAAAPTVAASTRRRRYERESVSIRRHREIGCRRVSWGRERRPRRRDDGEAERAEVRRWASERQRRKSDDRDGHREGGGSPGRAIHGEARDERGADDATCEAACVREPAGSRRCERVFNLNAHVGGIVRPPPRSFLETPLQQPSDGGRRRGRQHGPGPARVPEWRRSCPTRSRPSNALRPVSIS